MSRFNVNKMIGKAGKDAGIPNCHPHMLRHACGHLLADAGHDTRRLQLWLGHSDIKHTARYSDLAQSLSRISGAKAELRRVLIKYACPSLGQIMLAAATTSTPTCHCDND
jgi:integrase